MIFFKKYKFAGFSPDFPDFPDFVNYAFFALFCQFWTMITENGYNLMYNWLYIRKAYCFCFNLRGHNYFYDKWFKKCGLLKNRPNFEKIGQKSGKIGIKSQNFDFFRIFLIFPIIFVFFYNRTKFYAFSTIFGDFMGGGWNPPPPHLVSPKKPAPGRVKGTK